MEPEAGPPTPSDQVSVDSSSGRELAALQHSRSSLLFGVQPLDPLSLGGVCLVLLVVATLACYAPARRAASVDPAVTLRSE